MESWKSNCLIVESDPERRKELRECVTMHGFGVMYCDSLASCPLPNDEPDAVIFGPGAEIGDDEVNDVELLIRECQVPILCLPSQKAQLIERYEDVHAYFTLDDASHMVLSFVLSHLRRRNIREMMVNAVAGITQLTNGEFTFKSLEEAQALALLIASLAPEKKILRLGLMELFVNAIEHGNLGITHEEKIQLRNEGKWIEEVEKRQSDEKFRDLYASLKLKRDGDRLKLCLCDEGQGFDWKKVLQKSKEKINLTKSGRGIVIIQKAGLDDICYQGCGNIVEFSFKITRVEEL
ncbi:hypothetical protein MTBPR1_30296 [Candidatus Terasakiella magnetica]|uniref:Histidine kinase/HSP90-like ATPase domain-containing protein n=1 Tax=Candidatus Terasakiella magnetica TaxID=1867952 RepID=A0A1C3RI39_9PROT|nr:ATP-binding protein [Candidatus Terasakiella magnetica]SCA56926.1 hypothetical protein MTBPR1_30296 [Candidatus Terasakiella magnetica]